MPVSTHIRHLRPRLFQLHLILLLIIGALCCGPVSADTAGEGYRHGISFFHDLKYPADFEHFDYVNPDAPKGGTLVMATQTDFNTLSPISDFLVPAPGLGNIYNQLISRSGDEMSGFYGQLADGIRVAEDRFNISFRLHPRARWHDGLPVTAKDVKATVKILKTSIGWRDFLHFIDSIEVLNEREFILRLTGKLTPSNIRLLTYMPVLPAQYWEHRDPKAATLEPPLGSGPYRVADVKQGRHISFERVADYWGKDIPVHKGLYNFDEMQYEVYRDAIVSREAFRKGLTDLWVEMDLRFLATAYDIPARDKGWLLIDRREYKMETGVRAVVSLNNRMERFKDIRVREALALAMDFDWQNRVLHYGMQERAASYFPGTVLAARGLPDEKELALLEPFRDQLPDRLFAEAFQYPHSSGSGRSRAPLKRAKELLAQAGWRIRDGVLVNDHGEPFEIEFLSVSAANQRTLLPYFYALRLLGITGSIRMVESAQFIHLRQNLEYEAMIRDSGILMPPVLELFDWFHSASAEQPFSENIAGITRPVVDALVENAMGVTTLEEMITACRALDRVLLWGFHEILLDAIHGHHIIYWDRFGRPEREDVAAYESPFPNGWWYDEERAARIELVD
ncbi:MAG: extracellular solute-binding protein [Desulfobacterales bacterium]